MLQAQDLLVLFIHFCDTGRYLIKRKFMQEINARKVSLPYADPGFFFLVGGGGGGCLKTTLTIFSVLNFNLHFTVIERRSRIRACPHSYERLILGVGVLIYFLYI